MTVKNDFVGRYTNTSVYLVSENHISSFVNEEIGYEPEILIVQKVRCKSGISYRITVSKQICNNGEQEPEST